MNLSFFYHRNSNLVAQDSEFIEEYEELLYALKSIGDRDLIDAYEKRKKTRKGIKSLSEPINNLIKNKLKKLDWSAESGIFKEPPYNTTNIKRWRLDFAKNNIAVEVAFNHGEAIAHNIIKPVLSS